MITIACIATLGALAPQSEQEPLISAKFSEPIQLMAADEPLGIKRMYPSPRLYDIDRDGKAELVIGDLMGRVMVAEKADGDDPAAWGKLATFMSGRRALKFHNW